MIDQVVSRIVCAPIYRKGNHSSKKQSVIRLGEALTMLSQDDVLEEVLDETDWAFDIFEVTLLQENRVLRSAHRFLDPVLPERKQIAATI